jgi:hypothetical protein
VADSPTGGVAHGDETRGGSGSKVNMEAMLLYERMYLCGGL